MMSPAAKSKSKDKRASGKEQQKTPSKSLTNANTGGGIPTSGYNPLLGTFHTLDTVPVSSAPPLHVNGRFHNMDEAEDQNSFGGIGVEYDSVSNNGSWSGESEDHKDKFSNLPSRQEATILPGSDGDKREKIRQKNERKHQRQKEKRAQELHERCSGYLMSRKLESLAQHLVQMGFPSERATMALILNEGRLEESVAWLIEEADNNNSREHNLDEGSGRTLKIDISEELGLIADMETKFKCSKQDVEKAIVACEGDIKQAADTLRVQKPDPPSVALKPEETGDPPTFISNSSKAPPTVAPPTSQNSLRPQPQPQPQPQPKPTLSAANVIQKRDGRDFNYTKMAPNAEPGSKNMQLLKKIEPKLEWSKQQMIPVPSAVEKRWPVAGSVSYSVASSPLQASQPIKNDAQFMSVGNGVKNLQLGSVKEPAVVMQRSQQKQQIPSLGVSSSSSSSSSSLSIAAPDWHPPNGVKKPPVVLMKSNSLTHIPITNSNSTRRDNSLTYASGGSNHQLYDQTRFQQPQQYDPGPLTNQGNGFLWNNSTGSIAPPTPLAAASSLGHFCGVGSTNGPSSPPVVDWNAGESTLLNLDYTNIDWSLDRASPLSSRQSMTWRQQSTFRPVPSNGDNSVVSIAGVEGGGGGGGSREWTSPFEENDVFSFPRQFVTSPSLSLHVDVERG